MRYAIFSDVHANLEAFKAILADANKKQVDKFISLGDIIGYGPNPNECIKLTQEIACISLAGNHDCIVLHPEYMSYLNPYAKQALLWTSKNLTSASLEYIKTLPLVAQINKLHLTHASPYQPQNWNYISSLADTKLNFQHFETQMCLTGHSHVPKIIVKQGINYYTYSGSEIIIEDENRYIINVGSVGQPRDGNKNACYALYNTSTCLFQLRRVKYKLASTQKKMLMASLPSYLITRLAQGQ